jgi:DHA3 family tetracycline resistance protein-like MFS transporter
MNIFTLRPKFHAYTIFLIIEGASSLLFSMIFTIAAVYRVTNAGLNPFQLVLVGTVLEGTVMLFQIPTGIWADAYSRRLSVIIGMFIMGIAFIIEGSFPIFLIILVAQVIRAIGLTFASGAEEAWIADELGDSNIAHIYLRGSQVGLICTLIGTFLSVTLASVQLNLPFLIGGSLFFFLGLFLAFTMPEKIFKRDTATTVSTTTVQKSFLEQITVTLGNTRRALRLRPVLLTILCIAAFYGMASEGFDRLWPDHFLMNLTFPTLWHFKSVVWFGIISAGASVLSLIATEVLRRSVNTNHHGAVAKTLLGITILLIGAVVVFALAGNFYLALGAYWLASSLRQTHTPLYTAWVNQNVESNVRATVLSTSSQFDAFGQMIGGPIVGAIGTLSTLRTAMVSVAGVLSPTILLFILSIRQGSPTQSEIEAPTGQDLPVDEKTSEIIGS